MNIIFLYGPPGVGKLTVAEELVRLTGYKLLYNHLVADKASALFDYGTREYSDAAMKMRLGLIETSLEKSESIILTFAYGLETYEGESDDQFIKQLISLADEYGADLQFFHLTCKRSIRRKRIQNNSRKRYKKLTDPAIFDKIESSYTTGNMISGVRSIRVDTSCEVMESVKTILKAIRKK